MLYIGVYAYGENRFNLTFDPCFANILSMCPINASVAIEGAGIIPISQADVAGIPDIALSIPDFEGEAIIRVFGNSTQSQIACYSAVLTNGHTFSHPAAVGSTVGIFVALAFVASVATALYGQGLQETRKHYAHSLSMLVVFSILQHVFFTGALSVNFPSVLPAFWSNFGWASGMIYSSTIENSINHFVGNNRGNISTLGTAVSGQTAVNLGGGYSLSSIYRRGLAMSKRDLVNTTTGFQWYGSEVAPGLPLPGNFSSFAGTLAELQIPASNAFLTGLIWVLVILALLVAAVVVLKAVLELCALMRVSTARLSFFRRHWIYCAMVVLLRACYVAFFMMTFLALFQFTIGGASGPLAIAGIVLCLFLIGMVGTSLYALWYRLAGQQFRNEPDQLQIKPVRAAKLPWFGWTRRSTAEETNDERRTVATLPWRHTYFSDPLERPHVHDDDDYLIKFGWLSARFRRSKWWFFSAWLVYEFVRACFYGGAAGSPLIQVFGLLVWEILCLFAIVVTRPFESDRLNMLMVYLLGFSKVISVALCSAFDPRFNLPRILTTVLGVVIIVVQGIVIVCMLVAIVVSCVSSYMSIRRYKAQIKPAGLTNARHRYFAHIEQRACDKPLVKPEPVQESELSHEPKQGFSVTNIKRLTKIEDENAEKDLDDAETLTMDGHPRNSMAPSTRAASIRSRTSTSHLPYGARRHRASWSTRDFSQAGYEPDLVPSGVQSRMSMESVPDVNRENVGTPTRKRGSSMRHSWTNDPSLVDVANAATDSPANNNHRRHAKSKSLSQNQLQARYEAEEDVEERPGTSTY